MTDPVDPNPYPEYMPPPPFAPQPPSPYGAPPGYGPPPPYGAAFPYGAAPPYGWPAPPPPPPSHQGRNVIIVSVATVLLAALVIAYFVLTNQDSSPDRLAVPESFGGYVRSHDATANQVESLVREMASAGGGPMQQVFDAATVAVYEDESDVSSKLVVFALRTSVLPSNSGSPTTFGQSLLTFMGPTVHEVAAGPHRGHEQCGRTAMGVVAETACSWSDRATSGLVLSVSTANHPLVRTQLSQLVWSLRDEID